MRTNRDIIKELGKLREVKPAEDFLAKNRNALLTILEKDVVKESNVFAIANDKKMWYDLREKVLYKLLKPAGVLFLALSVITGGGIGMSFASQNTIPGDIFYPVKLTIEKAQVSLKTTEEGKVKLEVEFAGRRLEELNKVKASEIKGNKKESQKTKIVLDNFKKNIETVKDRLDKMKEREFTKETGDVVDMVEKKTLEYTKTLENIGVKEAGIMNGEAGGEVKILKDGEEGDRSLNQELGIKNGEVGNIDKKGEGSKNQELETISEPAGKNGEEGEADVETRFIASKNDGGEIAETADEESEFKKVVSEALAVSEEANNKAFGIIIEKQQSGELNMSKEEVVQKVKDKIDDIKIKVENLKDQAGIIKTQENDSGIDKKDSMIGETAESQSVLPSESRDRKSIKSLPKADPRQTDGQAPLAEKVEGGEKIVVKDGNNENGSMASSTINSIGNSGLNLEVSTSTLNAVAGKIANNPLPASQLTNMGDKLTEVDNLLKNGEIANAFEKVKEIKEIAKDVEKKLEAAKVNVAQDASKIIKTDTGVIATSTAKTATTTKK